MSWELKSLENVCSLITDGAHWSPIDIGDGFPMPSVKDMTDNGFDYTNCKKISESDFLKLKNSNCSPKLGDVLIAKDGSYLKHCFSFNGEEEIAILSSIAIFRPNVNIIDSIFLEYLFRSPAIKSLATGYVSGVAVPRIVLKDFKKIQLPIPSLETQKRIASILSTYDDLIENNLKRIKLLEETAQNIYKEWFVNFRFPNYEHTAFDEVSGLPVGWEMKTINDFGKVITGKTPSTDNLNFYGGNIPFVKTPDMHDAPYVSETSISLTNEGAESQSNKYLPKNSVMVSCIGTAGVVSLTSESCQTNQQINSVTFDEEYKSFYFYGFARGLKPLLEGLGSNGATMVNVNKSKFESIPILIPNSEVLIKHNKCVKPLFEQILILQNQNKKLKEARDILLPRLMNRTIEV